MINLEDTSTDLILPLHYYQQQQQQQHGLLLIPIPNALFDDSLDQLFKYHQLHSLLILEKERI